MNPQNMPNSAMPAKAEGLNPVRAKDAALPEEPSSRKTASYDRRRAASPGKTRRSRTRDISRERGSKSVEHGADDVNTRIAQLPDDSGRIGKTRIVLAGENHSIACPESHVVRIRVELGRGRVEQDDVEFGPHFL